MTRSDQSSRSIPAGILLALVETTWNPIEIKAVLAVAALGGLNDPISRVALLSDPEIIAGSRADGSSRSPAERIDAALETACARGSLVRLVGEDDSTWFLLGTTANQRRARREALVLEHEEESIPLHIERPNVFGLYEQNIGLVTPLIADRLADALDQYPETWIEDAISEAVTYNRRSWRYIERILINWATEGRNDATHQRDSQGNRTTRTKLRDKYSRYLKRE